MGESTPDDEFIDVPHVGLGMYEALKKSERLYDDAKILYMKKRFVSAVPLFVNSIEEALKGYELAIKFRKCQSCTREEWNNLLDHKHKLVHVKEFAIEVLKKSTQKELDEMSVNFSVENIDKKKMINILQSDVVENSQLQNLKEKCLYTDWDSANKMWDDFEKIDSEKQEDLTFYVMKKAEYELDNLRFGIEHAVNSVRLDGNMIKDLPYPRYAEFRDVSNYESLKSRKSRSRGEKIKFAKGKRILQKFMIKKSFHIIYQEIPFDNLKKYLDLIKKQPDEEQFPHPIIRAILLAYVAANKNDHDGNYAGVSGDAEETMSGDPMMSTLAIVSRKGEQFTIEKIAVITDKSDEYNFNDKIIEYILDTEMVIERFSGKDVPLEAVHEAYSKVGLKLRKLKDEEIEPAIEISKKLIKEDKFRGIPQELTPKILSATRENWEDLDPQVRSLIGSSYATTIPPEENQIIMTGTFDPLPKFKVRGMLYQTLKRREFLKHI